MGKVCFVILFCAACIVFSPIVSSANPEYARATGKACATCHEKSVPDRGRVSVIKFLLGQPSANGLVYHGQANARRVILIVAAACFLAVLYVHLFEHRRYHCLLS